MTIKFLLLVNKQGQTRLAKYFTETLSIDEKRALEAEIVRKCLARTDKQVRTAACVHARSPACDR
jgi:AP-4 complex subunit sigma-1